MDMWEALIPAAISAVGSFIGGERANEQSAEVAREQMAFQERLSNSAHQREVADLKAAGLNPILSTRLGGASSPAGAMPNVRDSVGDASRAGADKILQGTANSAQVENVRANTEKLAADTDLSRAQVKNVEANTYKTQLEGTEKFLLQPNVIPQSQANLQSTVQANKNAAIKEIVDRYGISTARAAAAVGDIDDDFFRSGYGRALRMIELGSDAVNPLVNSADSISRMRDRERN